MYKCGNAYMLKMISPFDLVSFDFIQHWVVFVVFATPVTGELWVHKARNTSGQTIRQTTFQPDYLN